MKSYLLLVVAFFLSACTAHEPRVPPELVGIWASEAAVLRDGKWLISGQALYIGADGTGAVLGGPPPIGVKVSVTFDAAMNALAIDLIERGKLVGQQRATYDPNGKTINMGAAKPVALTRRSEIFDSSIKKGLGL
ncbi:MAG: hypothetical protein WAV95_18050 [Azonexus sp.]